MRNAPVSALRTDLGISLEAPKPSSTLPMKLEHAFCTTILCLKCQSAPNPMPSPYGHTVIFLRPESRCCRLCTHLPETLLMDVTFDSAPSTLYQVFAPPETHQAHSFLLAFCFSRTCKVLHTTTYSRAELPISLLFKYYPPFINQLLLQA